MPKRDGSSDDAARYGSADDADGEQSPYRLKRGAAPSEDGSRTFGHSIRLRGFIDRLFENTMPRTAAGEGAKRRRAAPGSGSPYPQPAGWDESSWDDGSWTAGPAQAAGLRSAVAAGG